MKTHEVLLAIAVVLLAGIGLGIAISNYNECRSAGFSLLYCATRR